MLSALVLPHGSASRINALVVGGLVIAAAAWGLRREVGRLTSTLLAVWLGLSAILLPASTAAISVNLTAAVSILVVSLLPGGADLERRRQPTEITASTAS